MRFWRKASKVMPLTTSTMRAAALMPLWVYFHFSPGSYCIGAASQSGTRSASVFAFCASGPLASPSPEVWVRICVMVRLAGLLEGVFRSAESARLARRACLVFILEILASAGKSILIDDLARTHQRKGEYKFGCQRQEGCF